MLCKFATLQFLAILVKHIFNALNIARAPLAISAETIVIAKAEVDMREFACTSDWRYFQRTHVDIGITSDICDALIWFFE